MAVAAPHAPSPDAGSTPPRRVGVLAVLGDSTAVGLGDPLPGGGWRGFGPLLTAALGGVRCANLAFTGARVRCVRERQLPAALLARPDAAVLVAGMNDTLRADFDPARLRDDLDTTVLALQAAGAVVVMVRFHDHSRVFWLPGPLRRELRRRIDELNEVVDLVAARRGASCLDIDRLPGAYHPAAWSVDRLHPSERGHRLLAGGFAELLAGAGVDVPGEVDMDRSDGRTCSTADRIAWLIVEGLPWLGRRGRDLLPYAAETVWRDLAERVPARRPTP